MYRPFRVGDRYTYRVVDLLTRNQSTEYTQVVTEITDTEVIYNNGAAVTDLLGNPQKNPDGRRITQNQIYASEYSLGEAWYTRYRVTFPSGKEDEVEENFRVVAREAITVPAGTYDAFRVESTGHRIRDPVTLKRAYWVAPGTIARFIAHEVTAKNRGGQLLTTDRTELVSFLPGK